MGTQQGDRSNYSRVPGRAAACDPVWPQQIPGDPHPQRVRAGPVSADGCGPPRVARLPEDCRVVGFIGRLVEQKSPDVLIEAFATTANMLPQCRLVVVGSGPLERSLRVMADLLGIANKVLWLGERDGKCLLPAFDLLALPSRYEGLPLVTLEALSAGLPVVATATAGVELPIRHRRNGLIVPPDRPDLFAMALVELLSDPLKLEQFGRRSREISTEFTVRRMVESTHNAYLDCIDARVMEARPRLCEGVR